MQKLTKFAINNATKPFIKSNPQYILPSVNRIYIYILYIYRLGLEILALAARMSISFFTKSCCRCKIDPQANYSEDTYLSLKIADSLFPSLCSLFSSLCPSAPSAFKVHLILYVVICKCDEFNNGF